MIARELTIFIFPAQTFPCSSWFWTGFGLRANFQIWSALYLSLRTMALFLARCICCLLKACLLRLFARLFGAQIEAAFEWFRAAAAQI